MAHPTARCEQLIIVPLLGKLARDPEDVLVAVLATPASLHNHHRMQDDARLMRPMQALLCPIGAQHVGDDSTSLSRRGSHIPSGARPRAALRCHLVAEASPATSTRLAIKGLRDAGSGVSLLRVITFGSAPSLAQELSTQQVGNVAGEAPEA